MSERLDIDRTEKKEAFSSDKLRSVLGLIFGTRAHQFDAFLERVPTSSELTLIAAKLEKPEIRNTIFDLDGNLVPPYANISDWVIPYLQEYQEDGRKVGIYTNSPHTDRLDVFRDAGISVAETGIGKPTLKGFQRLCEAEQMDPFHTAMIGNFPVTDMPLVSNGEAPFFPLNILVESIPPDGSIRSLKKDIRARCIHQLNLLTARIVLIRNRTILRDVISKE